MSCQYCESKFSHPVTACPRVKSVEFDADGNILRVEKFEPAKSVDFTTGSITSAGNYKVTYSIGEWDNGKNDKEEPH